MKNKNKEFDIVFLLDRSGSMGGIEDDTIGGFNSYIKNNSNKNAKVTTILFDNQYEMINKREDIKKVKKLTKNEYFVRGTTALLDAIGKSIEYMNRNQAKKVMFVITTDGLENASRKYNKEQIKELIEGHKNWEFIYIGANIDSYHEGNSIGISKRNIANYKKDKKGVANLFNAVSKFSNMFMSDSDIEPINESWKENLE